MEILVSVNLWGSWNLKSFSGFLFKVLIYAIFYERWCVFWEWQIWILPRNPQLHLNYSTKAKTLRNSNIMEASSCNAPSNFAQQISWIYKILNNFLGFKCSRWKWSLKFYRKNTDFFNSLEDIDLKICWSRAGLYFFGLSGN